MPYSFVSTRVPWATVPMVTGLIVVCCRLAIIRGTTSPPRWIRPRMGGLSFASVPRYRSPFQRLRHWNLGQLRPVHLSACDGVRAAPFGDSRRLTLVAGRDVNFVDPAGCSRIWLHLALQSRRRHRSGQPAAQLLRHGLDVGRAEAMLSCDLPVREAQPHEAEAQHPHAQRLVMAGRHRSGEVVETPCARLAAIPLPLPVRVYVVAPVANHRGVAASRAADPLWPAVSVHEGEALGVVHQVQEADQIRRGRDGGAPPQETVRVALPPSDQRPAHN